MQLGLLYQIYIKVGSNFLREKLMKKPILLQKRHLSRPIEQVLERIEKIRQRKMNNDDSIILEGLFALGVSSFENSIIDTLRILLTNIPDKLDIKSEPISKEQLINGNPLKQAVCMPEIKIYIRKCVTAIIACFLPWCLLTKFS